MRSQQPFKKRLELQEGFGGIPAYGGKRFLERIYGGNGFFDALEERKAGMHIADLHCDTISKIYQSRKRGEQTGLLSNHLQTDIKKMKKGGYLLQNFAVFTDMEKDEENPYLCAKNQIALFYEEMERNASEICHVKTAAELEKNKKEGRISAVLTLEEGEICEGSVKKLEEFYQNGVRMMTFTWNYENSLGTGRGLTEKGIAFLEKMEDLGIIADVSHLSDAGFYDVCRYAKKPFAASHSNARALCGHKRNLTDDMILNIAKRGGVIGVNYCGRFLEAQEGDDVCESRVSQIADHILHIVHIGGAACVGLGSDFDGFLGGSELSDCSKMELLWEELKRRGISEDRADDIFFQNVFRIYKECW